MAALIAQLSHDASKWMNNTTKQKPDNDNSHKTDSEIMSELMNNVKDEKLFGHLFNPQFHHASKLFNKLAHKMDISYPKQASLNPIDAADESNQNIMHDLRYSMRCAFLAYPPLMTAFKSQTMSLTFKTTKQALKTCLNISDNDIIIDNCSLWNKTHQPSFYLITDHNRKKIVLSIRGTTSIPDIMTDLNANPKSIIQSDNKYPFKNVQIEGGGFVHEGMLQSAEWIRDKVESKLIELCNKYKQYQIIITGHSMGAAVASLLGLMYKDDPIIHKQNRLKVFAFAPPCIVSKEYNDNSIGCNDYITSVILGLDIVTRLSLESVKRWNLRQQLIMNYNQDAIRRCLLESESEVKETEMNLDESSNGEFLRVLKELKSSKDEQELYALGRILWFVPNIVMNDDINFRKRALMNLDNFQHEIDEKKGSSSSSSFVADLWNSVGVRMDSNSSMSNVWREFYHDISRSYHDIKTDIRHKLDSTKRNKKYDGNNYTLIDATNMRSIFQELIIDIECISVHEPQVYLWACNAKLREEEDTLCHEQDCF